MNVDIRQIPGALASDAGIPYPDWLAVHNWLGARISPEQLNDVWTRLAKQWLNRLAGALPEGYRLSESSEFLLLCKTDEKSSGRLLHWCENARQVILDTLPGVARDEGFGKHVMLAFHDSELYYDYVSHFYPEDGEFGLSGGMFLDSGYGHFVVCAGWLPDAQRVIAHEMNHALLRHLPLPLWLNEGVTQVMEDIVVENSHFIVDQETLIRHRQYWTRESIDRFWSGSSFFSADQGQELSYHLSQILFRNLMSDFPKQILDYLNAANHADAGNLALIDLCGVSLSERVAQFLGPGDWEPRVAPGSIQT